jgi:hypothetical protein
MFALLNGATIIEALFACCISLSRYYDTGATNRLYWDARNHLSLSDVKNRRSMLSAASFTCQMMFTFYEPLRKYHTLMILYYYILQCGFVL